MSNISSKIRTNVEKKEKKLKYFEQLFMLDETDKKILSILLADSRLSFRQIAQRVGVSVATVIERIRNLEANGIIKYYTAVLDHEKMGYELSVVIEITVSKGKLIEVEQEIAKHRNVCAVYDVTGLTDAMVIAKFKNRKELNNFVKSLLAMPYVERTNTHVVLNTVKEDFRLL
jgi:DNA-binding Lrp family transcriptional regulator